MLELSFVLPLGSMNLFFWNDRVEFGLFLIVPIILVATFTYLRFWKESNLVRARAVWVSLRTLNCIEFVYFTILIGFQDWYIFEEVEILISCLQFNIASIILSRILVSILRYTTRKPDLKDILDSDMVQRR